VRLLDGIAATALGAAGGSALLVRPDGKPAGVLAADEKPAPALREEVAAIAA
jgi:hypothetical protein